jgi:hypothetical protein
MFHPPIPPLNGRVVKNPRIMMGVIEARGENFERNPLPPTVKAAQVKALPRIRRSPRVEVDRNRENEHSPFEMTRETPINPSIIPAIFLTVMTSPRNRRAPIVIKIGYPATIQLVSMAVVYRSP